jgi:hypothetical protein
MRERKIDRRREGGRGRERDRERGRESNVSAIV